MAEPYRAPPEGRPRWVLTCWPRASAWPFLLALVAGLPCAVVGWYGERAAQVLSCNPTLPPSMRCTVRSNGPLPADAIESCASLPAYLGKGSSLLQVIEVRRYAEPFAANDLNVMVAGAPVVIAKPVGAGLLVGAPVDPSDVLTSCAMGATSEAIDVEIHRRNPWLLAAPLLLLVLGLRWVVARRVRVVLDPGARSARVTRLGALGGSTSVVLDDTTRPGWVQLGDTQHEGELVRAATRKRLARWLAARAC